MSHQKADISRYVCAHCGARPPRGDYMVTDTVWAKAGMPKRGFLCLSCLEARLVAAGHESLKLDAFKHVPCNAGIYFGAALAARSIADQRGDHRGSLRIDRALERLFERSYTRRKRA